MSDAYQALPPQHADETSAAMTNLVAAVQKKLSMKAHSTSASDVSRAVICQLASEREDGW